MATASILADKLGKKAAKKLYLNAKVLCAKFGYKRPGGRGGVGGHAHGQTRPKACLLPEPKDPRQIISIFALDTSLNRPCGNNIHITYADVIRMCYAYSILDHTHTS